jgi:hypothetical protein
MFKFITKNSIWNEGRRCMEQYIAKDEMRSSDCPFTKKEVKHRDKEKLKGFEQKYAPYMKYEK